MKISRAMLAALLCLFITAVNAQSTNSFQSAFKELDMKKDEFTQKIYYYDKRVDTHNLTGDGMFAGLEATTDNMVLKFVIYHQVGSDRTPDFITEISLRAGDSTYNFTRSIAGNGTHFVRTTIMGVGNDKTNFCCKVLQLIIDSGVGMIRYKTPGNTIKDYSLSKREIKELKTVVDAWKAWHGVQ